jgi:hypothetical protein
VLDSTAAISTPAFDSTPTLVAECPPELRSPTRTLTPSFQLTEEFARRFAERLAAEDPEPQYKRARPLSRREIVSQSYETIMRKRRAGYSFEGIAIQFAALGLPISIATLKNYLQHHTARTRARLPADTPTNVAAESTAVTAGRAAARPDRCRSPTRRQSRTAVTPKKARADAGLGGGEERGLEAGDGTGNEPANSTDVSGSSAAEMRDTDGRDAADAIAHPTSNEKPISRQGPTNAPDLARAETPSLPPDEAPTASEAQADMTPATVSPPNVLRLAHPTPPPMTTTAPASQAIATREDSSTMARPSAAEPRAGGGVEGSDAAGIVAGADLGRSRLSTLRAHASPIKNAFTPRNPRDDKDL